MACHCGKDGHPFGSVNCPVHGYQPRTVMVQDKNDLLYEAFELRREGGSGKILIDARLAETVPGGIEAIRNAIQPRYLIVAERLI